MGNRAVITSTPYDENQIGVYLHWNGGIDSVLGFLAYCDAKGYRNPTDDPAYGYAMLVNVITNFFQDGLSCGVDICKNLDTNNSDNGTYLIEGWKIVDMLNGNIPEVPDVDTVKGMVEYINNTQPESMKMPEDQITDYFNSLRLTGVVAENLLEEKEEEKSWINPCEVKPASLKLYKLYIDSNNQCEGYFVPKNILPETLEKLGFIVPDERNGVYVQSGYYQDCGPFTCRLENVVGYKEIDN